MVLIESTLILTHDFQRLLCIVVLITTFRVDHGGHMLQLRPLIILEGSLLPKWVIFLDCFWTPVCLDLVING